MEREDIEIKVAQIFSSILGQQVAAGENIYRSDVPEWDSLKHIELLFSIEDGFDFQFSEEELARLDNFQAIVDRVSEHYAA